MEPTPAAVPAGSESTPADRDEAFGEQLDHAAPRRCTQGRLERPLVPQARVGTACELIPAQNPER
jgi:hypothetical protein